MNKVLGTLASAGAGLLLLTAAASAQAVGIGQNGVSISPFSPQQVKRPVTQEDVERQQRLDDDYKAATNKIPDQKSTDPWGNVRSSTPSQASAAKKKPPVKTAQPAVKPAQ
jgi:hypothetical protein